MLKFGRYLQKSILAAGPKSTIAQPEKIMLNRIYKHLLILATFISPLALKPIDACALDLYGFASHWEMDDADGTWGVGGGVAIPLLADFLRLDARGYYFEGSDIRGNDSIDVVPLDLGLQVHILPNEFLDPYILGGVSYVYIDADRYDFDEEFGAYAGGGLQLNLFSSLSIFSEVIYRDLQVDSDSFGSDELSLDGVTVNTGLKLRL